MFGKVTLISVDNPGQSFLHGRNVSGLGPHQNRFRHTTGDIIHLKLFIKRVVKCVRNRFYGIYIFQILGKIFISIGE